MFPDAWFSQSLLFCVLVSASKSRLVSLKLQAPPQSHGLCKAGLSTCYALPVPLWGAILLTFQLLLCKSYKDPSFSVPPKPTVSCLVTSNGVTQTLIHPIHGCVSNPITEPCPRKGSMHIWWMSGFLVPIHSTVLPLLSSTSVSHERTEAPGDSWDSNSPTHAPLDFLFKPHHSF